MRIKNQWDQSGDVDTALVIALVCVCVCAKGGGGGYIYETIYVLYQSGFNITAGMTDIEV